jgi:hypothetical protein
MGGQNPSGGFHHHGDRGFPGEGVGGPEGAVLSKAGHYPQIRRALNISGIAVTGNILKLAVTGAGWGA